MKRMPIRWLGLAGASLLAACSSTPPVTQSTVMPFAKIRDAADSADGYYALGRALQRAGKLDDAERVYRQALEADPAHVEARNGMAAVAAGRGDLDAAIAILDSLVAAQPDQPHLLANLGHAHYLKGNYFNARVALEQAASLDPDNGRTREKLRLVLDKLGVPASEEPAALAAAESLPSPAPAVEASSITESAPGIYTVKFARNGSVTPAQQAEPQLRPTAVVTELTPSSVDQVPDHVPVGRSARVEVVNGNGVTGLARSVRNLIQGREWQVVRVANHVRYNVPVTRVEYAHGNRQAAEHLAQELQVEAVFRYNDALGDRVRIVLGHNLLRVAVMN